jgi:tetratricopeptide (TPR) repeat protein
VRAQPAAVPERPGLAAGRTVIHRPAPVPVEVSAVAPAVALPEPPAPAVLEPTVLEPAVPEPAGAPRVGLVVDECFALHQAGQYTEALERATGALDGADEALRPADAHGRAALWSVVALARQGLGDDAEARTALEAAVAAAPATDRPTYQRQLGTLAEAVARRLLAEAEQHLQGDAEACLAALRTATEWLDDGVAAVPGDTTLTDLVRDARERLWRTYERAVVRLLQRQEFRAARRLLREALDDAHFPPALVESFRDMFTSTFSGEIGQLTAQAIRSVQDARDGDALAALRRAETLLATLDEEALTAKRREEVQRRRWWVYSRLGERRLDHGEFETALEPLVHALGLDVGAERQEETRSLLERALDGCPDREAAIVHCDRLWARLRGAAETLAAAADSPPILEPQER